MESVYFNLGIRAFQFLFLFPVLQATENLPSLQEKKNKPPKKKQKKTEIFRKKT